MISKKKIFKNTLPMLNQSIGINYNSNLLSNTKQKFQFAMLVVKEATNQHIAKRKEYLKKSSIKSSKESTSMDSTIKSFVLFVVRKVIMQISVL